MKNIDFKKYFRERSYVYRNKSAFKDFHEQSNEYSVNPTLINPGDNTLKYNFDNFNKLAYEYFKNLTPSDPAYYSYNMLDYNLVIIDKIGKYCNEHNWEEILDMCFKRVITGMRMAKTYKVYYTIGNSKPDQFGFSSLELMGAALSKLIAEYDIQIGNKEEFDISFGRACITKKLGYGHTAEAWLITDMWIDVNDKGILSFKFTCKSKHDGRFHSEFDDIAKDMKEKMKKYKKKAFFKKPIFEQIFDDVI